MCVAIPSKIVEITGDTAIAEVGGQKVKARVDLLAGVKVGDYVLIHAGFAITIMDEDQALETLKVMEEVGML